MNRIATSQIVANHHDLDSKISAIVKITNVPFRLALSNERSKKTLWVLTPT
jgi:hypothetical protein